MKPTAILPRGLIAGLAVFVVLLVGGTVGFLVDGFGFVDAIFTTVTAITTVGYAPARPLSSGAKIFVSFLVVIGVGTGIYVLGSLTEYLMEGGLRGSWERRKMSQRISDLHDHFIIAGFGRVGQRVATSLEEAKTDFLVVDSNQQVLPVAHERGLLCLEGDATSDDQLIAAGIMRARALLACADSDVKNVYITLSARSLNPDLYIVARAADVNAERNLYNAGASKVVSPYTMAGNRMAHLAVQPLAADYVEMVISGRNLGVQIEERAILPGSPLTDREVGDVRRRELGGGHVLAVEHDGQLITFVNDDMQLRPNDKILVAGTAEQIARFDAGLTS
jgi:voltage-gated potassium channel